ncbi:S9 family peptidase [Sphingomonas hankyongi]|uniref:Acyl-peptide hydrolase n=1 Tax=Sphingomonas hankyongi TaxID=2908209 RepID=A0ABT0S313_9SPHN|nr:S9 family peptidase [Sphingomonas hankyongi]MCL6730260.1 S9 family peptidase [Sphingomonas hankyongi]
MKKLAMATALLLTTSAVEAQIVTPNRPVTDPRSLISPINPNARPVPLDDLAVSRGIRDAVFSADGRRIFISTNLTGRFNIWRIDASGSWPVQLTQSDDVQEGLAVSPDGATLYFMQDKGGDEIHDLLAVPTSGGEPRNLTKTDNIDEQSPVVSPNGRSIAFVSKREEDPYSDIALLDVASGAVRQLTHESEEGVRWGVVAWNEAGRSLIAIRESAKTMDSSVWKIDVASGRAVAVAQKQGVQFSAAGASADGRIVAASTNEGSGQTRAALLDATTGKWRWLKRTPWEQTATDVTPDGTTMIVRTNEDGRSSLSAVDMASGAERPLPLPPGRNGTIGAKAFSPDSRHMLATHAGADTPTELYVVDLQTDAEPRKITHLAMASVDATSLPKSEVVTFRSFDGTLVSAIVTMPANLKRDGNNPAVVLPHGGPTGQAQDGFNRNAAALASRGYVTIAPNFRGSTGYGSAFQNANRMDLGGGDLKDVVAAKRFLVDSGYVDPNRVGITGESYGGFMALMAIGRTPEEFAAAVQSYGINDWFALWKGSEPFLQQYQKGLLGDPVNNADVYKASSPLTYLNRAKAPLLSLQGANDPRVPRNQAEIVASRLQSQGNVVETIFYPDEGHGFTKREHQTDALKRTIEWFDRYLKPIKNSASPVIAR